MNRLIGDDPDFGVWLKHTFPKTVILNGAVGRRTEAESYSRRYYPYYRHAATSPHGCESSLSSRSPISSYEPCEWTSIDTQFYATLLGGRTSVTWYSCSDPHYLYGSRSCSINPVDRTPVSGEGRYITANFKRYITEMHLRDYDPAAIYVAEAREEAEYQLKISNLRPGDQVPARTKSDSTAWAKHLAAHLDALINGRFSEQDVLTGKGGARTRTAPSRTRPAPRLTSRRASSRPTASG